MSNKYDDIINLPHHISKTRPKMSNIDRAAQFSPFAALTGHGDAVKETARLTEKRINLDEYEKEALGERLQIIADHLSQKFEVSITYFKPDKKKAGGSYLTATGTVKKIDEYNKFVIMDDKAEIPIDEIVGIDGEIFQKIYNE